MAIMVYFHPGAQVSFDQSTFWKKIGSKPQTTKAIRNMDL